MTEFGRLVAVPTVRPNLGICQWGIARTFQWAMTIGRDCQSGTSISFLLLVVVLMVLLSLGGFSRMIAPVFQRWGSLRG